MSTFKLFSFAALFAALSLATGYSAPVEPDMPIPPVESEDPKTDPPDLPKQVDPKMNPYLNCAKACDSCERFCNLCAIHCAKMLAAGKKEHLETLQSCLDCAAICKAASSILSKNGPFSDLITAACADACKRCAELCEKYRDDPIMLECTIECRRCEKACRDLLKIIVKPGESEPEK